jgi:hypothetical protein
MSEIERVPPRDVREKVQSGTALLVCAYNDDAKYGRMRLDGSIPLSRFRSMVSDIAKEREIIFY